VGIKSSLDINTSCNLVYNSCNYFGGDFSMSSNNQIVIIKKKTYFEVHENSCVDNTFIPNYNSLISKEDTLEKAIFLAKVCCETYPYVEYGYVCDDSCFGGKPKKEIAKREYRLNYYYQIEKYNKK